MTFNPARNSPPPYEWDEFHDLILRATNGAVDFRAPRDAAILAGRTGADLAANAYWTGTAWYRFDATQPAALLTLDRTSQAVRLYTAAAGTGAITWGTPATVAAPPATDANGWQVAYQGDGKRRWRKRYAVTYRAVVADWLIPVAHTATPSEPLPVGVSTQAQVDIFVVLRHATGSAAGAFSVNLGVEGSDSATGFGVTGGTIDGTNLSTKAAGGTVTVEMVER